MGQDFQYDVFLSHSAKDKAVVRPLAERLRQDGLERSKCRMAEPGISENAFGSDWAQLQTSFSGKFALCSPR
jgi:hypothetical protein